MLRIRSHSARSPLPIDLPAVSESICRPSFKSPFVIFTLLKIASFLGAIFLFMSKFLYIYSQQTEKP